MSPSDAQPSITLGSIRRMLEGVIPGVLCTVSRDGTPHLCYLSQADYIDAEHVALSFQFFNRSRENILATRRATLSVDDPYTAAGVRMQLEYLRTETAGAVFERMDAKLAGIASHTGMDKVFSLQGADVYRVHAVDAVAGRRELAAPRPRCDLQPALRALSEALAAARSTEELLDAVMAGLRAHLVIDHAMLLMRDGASERLYTVASLGYDTSGVGSEIALGEGVAGIAAREGVPIRVGHLSLWKTYGRAVRERAQAFGLGGVAEQEIPMPGLAEPRSQMAVPLKLFGAVVGVLLLESCQDQHFSYDDEDALTVVANQLALQLHLLSRNDGGDGPPEETPSQASPPAGAALVVRHHPHNDSVFIGDEYLIKGVAGAIFRKVVADHLAQGRTEFTNRELRLDRSLKLPEVTDNLDVRLILLQRRLAERDAPIRIEKVGRGRFRLVLERPLRLETMAS